MTRYLLVIDYAETELDPDAEILFVDADSIEDAAARFTPGSAPQGTVVHVAQASHVETFDVSLRKRRGRERDRTKGVLPVVKVVRS